MEDTTKSIAYKEGWNANCKGHQRLSGHQYALGTPERNEWLQGYDEAQKQSEQGPDPRILSITYPNPLTEKDGWNKLRY